MFYVLVAFYAQDPTAVWVLYQTLQMMVVAAMNVDEFSVSVAVG